MKVQERTVLHVEDVEITGHAQIIRLRSYRPASKAAPLPVVVYFHGGGFVKGSLDDGDIAAAAIATETPAWVVSVGYSLAPALPFPTALEDGYRALQWAQATARQQDADPLRAALVGHEAGGNLATCVAAMARDRSEFRLSAQVLMAPLLDPSMARDSHEYDPKAIDTNAGEFVKYYRAYLPNVSHRMHPYAAPIESRRLRELPSALITSAYCDHLDFDAQKYAERLRLAGVQVTTIRHLDVPHYALAKHRQTLDDVVSFLHSKLI
ncbi:alpha/beta hydrolase [Paraburkholderia bengalensis]|uniref:Alpha/beta hydrolase n=1 Tax=Paraburkholderia bengalensis TaxID=2747562 RepID=A0ABU8J168_9BURK